MSTMNPLKSVKNWLQYDSISLARPTSITVSFCWPHLSIAPTQPTAGHVLSAHAHNLLSICRKWSSTKRIHVDRSDAAPAALRFMQMHAAGGVCALESSHYTY